MNRPTSSPIILIHGLVRTTKSMSLLAYFLRKQGHTVYNFAYPSHKATIEEHTKRFAQFLLDNNIPKDIPLHFITHSLGSLLARSFALSYGSEFTLGRISMLGPPNQGAQIARFLLRIPGTRLLFGPVLSEIAHLDLQPATDILEVGVIAGGIGCRIGFLPFVSGDNDGIVSVEETKLEGMRDFTRVAIPHAFLMFSPRVWRLSLNFLSRGTFE